MCLLIDSFLTYCDIILLKSDIRIKNFNNIDNIYYVIIL